MNIRNLYFYAIRHNVSFLYRYNYLIICIRFLFHTYPLIIDHIYISTYSCIFTVYKSVKNRIFLGFFNLHITYICIPVEDDWLKTKIMHMSIFHFIFRSLSLFTVHLSGKLYGPIP